MCRSLPDVDGLENGRCRDYPKGVRVEGESPSIPETPRVYTTYTMI